MKKNWLSFIDFLLSVEGHIFDYKMSEEVKEDSLKYQCNSVVLAYIFALLKLYVHIRYKNYIPQTETFRQIGISYSRPATITIYLIIQLEYKNKTQRIRIKNKIKGCVTTPYDRLHEVVWHNIYLCIYSAYMHVHITKTWFELKLWLECSK